MELAWVLFGLVGWAVAILLVFVLIQVAGDQDHVARRVEMRINRDAEALVAKSAHPEADDGGQSSTDKPTLR